MSEYRNEVMRAAVELREFASSGAARAMVELLDALDRAYREDLLTVPPERLARLQGAAAQVRALRNVLTRDDDTPLPTV
jgi:molecular chaperone GrpE (heat shock protein)